MYNTFKYRSIVVSSLLSCKIQLVLVLVHSSLEIYANQTKLDYGYVYTLSPKNIVICLNLNSVNQLIFVMVKCGVLFEVRTEFLNSI
jgi:hypothetical protein